MSARLALSVIAALTLARLAVLAGGQVPLFGDEAQYWLWAQDPAWGYFSKPPLIAWLIAATTAVFGDTGFGVRIGALVCHLGTAAVLFATARRLWGAEAGRWAAVTWIALPAVSVSSIAMSTDAPLLLFWAIALHATIATLQTGRGVWWIAFGIAFGLGMLAKFAMGYALAGLAVALLLTATGRKALKTPWPWAGLALGLLIFLPNLLWQRAHSFVTVAHVAEDSNVRGFALDPGELAEFLVSQIGVFGPLTMAAFVAALVWLARRRPRPPELIVVAGFALPPLLIVVAVALMGSANANWAATAYIGATLLAVGWALGLMPGQTGRPWRGRLLPTALALHLALAAAAYLYHPVASAAGITLTRKTDFLARQRGFATLAASIAPHLQRHPQAVLVTDHRMLHALMAFHLRPRPEQAIWSERPGTIRNHFDLVAPWAGLKPDEALFLGVDTEARAIRARYKSAEKLAELSIDAATDLRRTYGLWRLSGVLPPPQ